MDASRFVSVVGCCLLIGCRSVVAPGLANAPGLGGTSPETRVHDAIANGHEACERPAHSQGGTLRGQIPPCGNEEDLRKSGPTPLPPEQGGEASLARSHPLGFCPAGPQPRGAVAEKGVIAFPLSAQRMSLVCDLPGSATP